MNNKTYHFISFGRRKENLFQSLLCLQIGSKSAKISEYLHKDSTLLLHCDGMIWGAAKVDGKYFFDSKLIWSNDIYPHRFHITPTILVSDPITLKGSSYARALTKHSGSAWAYKFLFVAKPIPEEVGAAIEAELKLKSPISTQELIRINS